jgi:hypothetical protein
VPTQQSDKATDWTTDVRFSVGAVKGFFLRRRVQTGCGTHPGSYSLAARGSFTGVKALGREGDHSPASSAEVTNLWSYTSIPHTSSWRGTSLRTGLQLYLYPNIFERGTGTHWIGSWVGPRDGLGVVVKV